MADRTSAEIFGKVMRTLCEHDAGAAAIAAVWRLRLDYDFADYQAGIDDLLLECYAAEDEEA